MRRMSIQELLNESRAAQTEGGYDTLDLVRRLAEELEKSLEYRVVHVYPDDSRYETDPTTLDEAISWADEDGDIIECRTAAGAWKAYE